MIDERYKDRKLPKGIRLVNGYNDRYMAVIRINGIDKYLGVYPTVEYAATIYNFFADMYGIVNINRLDTSNINLIEVCNSRMYSNPEYPREMCYVVNK